MSYHCGKGLTNTLQQFHWQSHLLQPHTVTLQCTEVAEQSGQPLWQGANLHAAAIPLEASPQLRPHTLIRHSKESCSCDMDHVPEDFRCVSFW